MRNEKGFRILAQNRKISNDIISTGLNNNDIIIGTSGSGKTGGYVIPNIQNIIGSLIVSDTKGRLYNRFHDELEKKGYNVLLLDLVSPGNSCVYNPLSNIRRYEDGDIYEKDILTLAQSLIMGVEDFSEPIWSLSARSYIAFLICFLLENSDIPEEEKNLYNLCELNHAFCKEDLGFVDWIHKHPDSFASKKYNEIISNKNADKMWASILGFANVALEPYELKESRHIFGPGKSIDLRDLGRQKTALFLNVSDVDRAFDNTVNIIYTQALQVLCSEADKNPDGRLKVPVRIIMDDFASSAKIEAFDKIISVIRSREIYVSLILQSLQQLKTLYGEFAASTIIDNCDHILYLGSQNLETATYIGTRAFMPPEKVLLMPNDSAYLLEKGKFPELVKKVVPYSTVSDFQL